MIEDANQLLPLHGAADLSHVDRRMVALAASAGLADALLAPARRQAHALAEALLREPDGAPYLMFRVLGPIPALEVVGVTRAKVIDVRDLHVEAHAPVEDFSSDGLGCVVVLRFQDTALRGRPLRWAGVSVALDPAGCGDGWSTHLSHTGVLTVVVADGLGHGPGANEAAHAALSALEEVGDGGAADFFRGAHRAARGTRGAGASWCRIDPGTGQLTFAGLGNVEAEVFSKGRPRGLVPQPGTLGLSLTVPTARPWQREWEPGSTLVLHTDGVRKDFDDRLRRGTRSADPVVLAALTHRDRAVGDDDATVVVVQDFREATR